MKRLLRASTEYLLVDPLKIVDTYETLPFSTDEDAEEFCNSNGIDEDQIYYEDGEILIDCTRRAIYSLKQVEYSFKIYKSFGKKKEYSETVYSYVTTKTDYTSLNKELLKRSNLPRNFYIKKDTIEVLNVEYSTSPTSVTYR